MTRSLIVELEQSAGSPKHSFSIKRDLDTLSGHPSDITDTNGNSGSYSQSDNKLHRSGYYEAKATIIKSISWQLLYATNLLVAYELILTNRKANPDSNSDSWLPVEVSFAAGSLLRSCWNQNSLLFNPVEQQAKSMLTQGKHPFVTITTMFDSGHNSPEYPPPDSSGQHAPQATTQAVFYFTYLLHSDSGDGDEAPEQHSHTLGLNCFVDPCQGVCRFRVSSDNRESAQSSPDDVRMPGNASVTSDDLVIISGLLNLRNRSSLGETGIPFTLSHFTPPMGTSEILQTATASTQLDQSPPYLSKTGTNLARHSGQRTCKVPLIEEDGQHRPCGKTCKNARALSVHKSRYHTGQKTCTVIVVKEDGQEQLCRTICKNGKALSEHKKRDHTGQQICDVAVVWENGQLQPCGAVCKNVKSLSNHIRRYHTRQQTCDITVVGVNGLQRPCGRSCKNAQALSVHKSRVHTGQRTCALTVIEKDGQQRSCGTLCKNAQALSDHKSRYHSRQRTCDVTLIGDNGQQQPCGKACKNTKALSSHKNREHSGQKTCNTSVLGEDGQPQPCGKVCKNASDLSNHKRIHRKRKPDDLDRKDDLSLQADKVK
ncbi:hypothetical protein [Endozoicomonas sp. 8E]|uniref:hypothetical protein n=1 Tax=Endozoicomonas sp. 8E TaxID=3035692 RepID=UPI002939473C|nr:hypothetical protein [Endozoicomonas sp. 8E]WOG27037.1 hypothetical protein P6910_21170 [Endozoicomonas sp. 8E]